MEVLNFVEQLDGSAKMEVKMTDKERDFLVEYAINRILEQRLEEKIDWDIEHGNVLKGE
jgi:hypothetical protein